MQTTPTYRSWSAMITRCTNPKRNQWHNYGGRGIRVCERWRKFENFLADMGERPVGKTLDRFPNNDGNYEPGNCRWATWKEQAANRPSMRGIANTKNIRDITGQRFSRLVVQKISHRGKRRDIHWQCVCDCGANVAVRGASLRNGNTRSCGCLQKEIAARNSSEARIALAIARAKVQP